MQSTLYNALRRDATRLTWLNKLTAYGWEFALPLLAGVFALYMCLPEFWTSIRTWATH